MTGKTAFGRWSRGASEPQAQRGAAAVFAPWQRLLLLAGFAGLLVGRLPGAWRHGRFLDEEATVFLAYAWHHPWAEALFRPFGGYWNLVANASTLLVARLLQHGLRLEAAPYATMAIAFAFQLLPAVLLLFGRGPWLSSRAGVVASLLMVAVMPATEEVFYNILHSQFHLALCSALILALDVPRRPLGRAACGAILVVGPLCGPGAIMMLPLFCLRSAIERQPPRWMQAAALAAGSAIQLAVFYGGNPMRGHLVGPATLAAALYGRLLVLPLLGFRTAYHQAEAVFASMRGGGLFWHLAGLACVVAIGGLAVAAWRRRNGTVWLAMAALTFAGASFGYGMVILSPFDLFSVGAGERYNFLPDVLLGLTVVGLAGIATRGRIIATIVATVALIVATRDYLHPLSAYGDGPSWPIEVARWRIDHDHPMAVWPKPWTADLSDRARPCPPIGPLGERSTAPRYCESGWVASFYHPPAVR